MQKFFFNEQNKLIGLLENLNQAIAKFNNKDFDAHAFAKDTLLNCINVFESLGNTIKQSDAQVMLSEINLAQKGINPVNFEKQSTGRLELLNTITFKVLQQLQLLLANWYQQNDSRLSEARQLISQIITASLQTGLITAHDIKKYKSPQDAEKYCSRITKDDNIALGQQRVLLLVSRYDCHILFDELITGLK